MTSSAGDPHLAPESSAVTTAPAELMVAAAAAATAGVVGDLGSSGWSERSKDCADDEPPLTPVAADEKLLSDGGVSEFLPCADFMGPGLSPSPCFSFTDSPLGSQNSSPAMSPAMIQEEEEDPAVDATGKLAPAKSKILKRSQKPCVILVRNDHGGMEYRKVSDVDAPAVIRTMSNRRSFAKKLAARQIPPAPAGSPATVAVAAADSPCAPPPPESVLADPHAKAVKMEDDPLPPPPLEEAESPSSRIVDDPIETKTLSPDALYSAASAPAAAAAAAASPSADETVTDGTDNNGAVDDFARRKRRCKRTRANNQSPAVTPAAQCKHSPEATIPSGQF